MYHSTGFREIEVMAKSSSLLVKIPRNNVEGHFASIQSMVLAWIQSVVPNTYIYILDRDTPAFSLAHSHKEQTPGNK